MNLFEKVKCKGFYKPFKDGRWLYLEDDNAIYQLTLAIQYLKER